MLDGIWYRWHTRRPKSVEAAPSAETVDPLEAVPLVLKSTDGETLRTRYGLVKQSTTLVNLVEAQGETPDLSQPLEVQLDAKMLRAVIRWCDFHRGEPPFKLDMHPVRRRYTQFYLSDEERSYFDDHYLALWELAAAADYLNVSQLYYATCMTLYLLAKSHCWKTYKLIQAMDTAKCHVVPRNVSVSIYCDALRFEDDGNERYYIFCKYGGYLMKLMELHGAALPPQLRQAHVDAVSDKDVAYLEDRHKNDPDYSKFQKCIEKRVLINVHKFHYYESDIVVDDIGQLSQFALTDLYEHKIDDDHVMKSLRELLSGSAAVACETPNDEADPRQLVVFLPGAVDFKLRPHVALRIKVKDNGDDKIDDYDARKWLQLMRSLDRMHESAIRIRLKTCTLAPAVLRTLYEHYLSAEKPTGIELIMEPRWDQGLQRDVEPIAAELGLQLVRKERESRLYESMARRGFKFAAKFVTHYCDACVYDGLTLQIIKDECAK